MTLHEFLTDNGFKLDKKTQSKLGELISDQYRTNFSRSAPKIDVPQQEGPQNDYPQSFLIDCIDIMQDFLKSKYETTNG